MIFSKTWINAYPALISFVASAVLLSASPLIKAQTKTEDLSSVTLNISHYKGLHKTLLEASGLSHTPYKIEWKEFNVGSQHAEAVQSGSVDLASASEIPAVFAAQNAETKLKVIAVYKEDLNNQALFIPKNSSVKTVADLKGKRVAYTRGTTSHYYLYLMLKEAGLTFNDIDAKALSPSDALSAFAKGDLDAWAVWGFNGQTARQQFGAKTLKTAVGYLSGNFQILASAEAIADPKRYAAIADFLLRLQKAYAWSNKNYSDYAAAQSKETRIKTTDILELFSNRSQDYSLVASSDEAIASQQKVADVFYDLGLLNKKVLVSPIWDRRFDKLLKEGEKNLRSEDIGFSKKDLLLLERFLKPTPSK